MEINKYLTITNRTETKNRAIEYIAIHYTANDGDTAWANCNYFYKTYRGASAHYFVDPNSICQCVEDKDIAWHVGANTYYNGCRNSNSIGIEMCSKKDKNGNYYIPKETIINTAHLVIELAKKYNINIEKNLVTHYETTHKICPRPFVEHPEQWTDFKKLVKEGFMTRDEKIEVIKEVFGFQDNTIQFFLMYKYGDTLIDKLYAIASK